MSDDKWGGPGWLNKLSWLFDASVTLAGFSGEKRGTLFLHCSELIFVDWTSRSVLVAYLPVLSRICPYSRLTDSAQPAAGQR